MTHNPDTRLNRHPERGSQDFQTACTILDSARICHVGFTLDDQPYVIPMACARQERELLLHGSVVSRLMQKASDGLPICATATHLDGLVLARSAFHSSMNYRSVMLFGQARLVTDEAEKARGLDALVEHLIPGRIDEVRPSTRKEINATTLLALPIAVFTTKARSGPPDEPQSDIDAPVWAGVIPLSEQAGVPEDAPDLAPGLSVPDRLHTL
jgi:nitroimidazol reductase NimA-like FMN-containing flavoprotein (pyridoxamine 5'-phosphate oxidase superfamily)